ncbi:AT-rich interactive domain-containing protein 3A-like [Protopterus annectens]|uniref:AT-rich interactive domain-containing protein 3A-like n=1 Tax=Protopterus annectens TaxID=7888 RepID=UPI001CFBEEF4|nr:AT-rich interactive domain-containing protein 3A-like [Protopterus annectens]
MVDNTSVATKSALRSAFSPVPSMLLARTAPRPVSAATSSALTATSSPASSVSRPPPPPVGGLKLEAVMETLQRQQAARLALEERLREDKEQTDFGEMQTKILRQLYHQEKTILRSVTALPAAGGEPLKRPQPFMSPGTHPQHHNRTESPTEPRQQHETRSQSVPEHRPSLGEVERGMPEEYEDEEEDDYEEDMDVDLHHYPARGVQQHFDSKDQRSPEDLLTQGTPKAGLPSSMLQGQLDSVNTPGHQVPQHHEWTYEEQFKQAGDLDHWWF